MAADSFKITDRRSAFTDEKDKQSANTSVLTSQQKAIKQTQQPEPPKSSVLEPSPTSRFSGDESKLQGEFPEAGEFDELPEDQPEGTPETPFFRGTGRGTPFSMRPIELTQSLLGLLVQKAYVSLGLMPNPETGRIKRDLEDAGESIELLEILIKHFSGKWRVPGLESELQNQLSNLRLQYARLKG